MNMYINVKKKYFSKFSLIFWFTLILVVLILIGNMMKKSGFHIDEIYSYGLANSNYHPFPWEFDTWLSGKYYNEYVTVTENELFNYGSVYYNQTQDVHPPLYYFIIHTISSFVPGVFSKWIGLSVNLFIHLSVFYMMHLLIREIIHNKWVALSGATFWILSKGAIDSLLFTRMYPLLTLIQIGLLYVTLLFYKKEKNNWLLLYIFSLVTLGALTHYYFYIYSFLLTVVFCGIFLFEKKIKRMFLFGFTALGGIISAVVIFPSVFTHVTESNRGQEVLEGFENNLTNGGNIFFEFIQTDLLRNIPPLLLVLTITLILIWALHKVINNKSLVTNYRDKIFNHFKIISIIFLPVLIYIFIVQQVSFYKTPRYIFAVYPMIVITLFIVLYKIILFIFKDKKRVSMLMGLFSSLIIVFGLTTQESDYKFENVVHMDEQVENIEDQNILVIMDDYWKISKYVIDLKNFNQIYPVEITENLEDNLPNDEIFNSLNNLFVLYNKNDNLQENNVEETLMRKYNYDKITVVSNTDDYILYEFN